MMILAKPVVYRQISQVRESITKSLSCIRGSYLTSPECGGAGRLPPQNRLLSKLLGRRSLLKKLPSAEASLRRISRPVQPCVLFLSALASGSDKQMSMHRRQCDALYMLLCSSSMYHTRTRYFPLGSFCIYRLCAPILGMILWITLAQAQSMSVQHLAQGIHGRYKP